MNERTNLDIARKAREYLKGCCPEGLTLEVMEDQILKGEGWWRVPVRPNSMPTKLYAYYQAMAEVEEELLEKEGLNILFMTSEPIRVPVTQAGVIRGERGADQGEAAG